MCQHPRCGNRGRFICTGHPYGRIELCGIHVVPYMKHNPKMKKVDKDSVLRKLGGIS